MKDRIFVPLWFGAIILFLALGIGLRQCEKPPAPPPLPKASKAEIRYILDTAGLGAYKTAVRAAVGDSLARMFAARARAIRGGAGAPAPRGGDTVTLHDTDSVCLAGEDARTILVHDSSVIVSRDSARGFLAECSVERDRLQDSLARVEEPSQFWKWGFVFSAGAATILGLLAWGAMH